MTTTAAKPTITDRAHRVRPCDLLDIGGKWMHVEDIAVVERGTLAFRIVDPAGSMAQEGRTVHLGTNLLVDFRPGGDINTALAGGVRWGGPYADHTHDLNLVEVGMSDCEFGCKIWRCESCGVDQVLHSATYGCRTGGDPVGPAVDAGWDYEPRSIAHNANARTGVYLGELRDV